MESYDNRSINKNSLCVSIVIIISLLFLVPAYAYGLPSFPITLSGDITINDDSAPTGTVIYAYIGDVLRGQTTTNILGAYGNTGFNKLPVTGSSGDIITFKAKIPSSDTYATTDQTLTYSSSLSTYNLIFTLDLDDVLPPQNSPPIAQNITTSTSEDTTKTIILLADDTEDDPLSYHIVSGPSHGDLSQTDNTVEYNPDNNYVGDDSFTYKANDGEFDSNTATVSIDVGSVNDAPSTHNITTSTSEDTTKTILLIAEDVDVDTLSYHIVSGPSHGDLSQTDNTVEYNPNKNYVGNDSFTYKANDGQIDSNIATVSIDVGSVNDAPTAYYIGISTFEDTNKTIHLFATDADADTLSYHIVSGPAHGDLFQTDNVVEYNPDKNYVGNDSFTYKVNDGNVDSNIAIVSINLDSVNDAPIVLPLPQVTINVGDSIITLWTLDDYVSDETPDLSILWSFSGNTNINITINPDRTINFTALAGWSGQENIIFTASDGEYSDSSTVTTTVIVPRCYTGDGVPSFPISLSGDVTINDAPAPTGTTIEAIISNRFCGTTTTNTVGAYGNTAFNYLPVTGTFGEIITFRAKIPGYGVYATTNQTLTYGSGDLVNFDLHFIHAEYSNGDNPDGNPDTHLITIISPENESELDTQSDSTLIEIETDVNAVCKYDDYDFDYVGDGHLFTVTGNIAHSFNYDELDTSSTHLLYYSCSDDENNIFNTTHYFTIKSEDTGPPGFPHSFYGDIIINGIQAPTGTVIEALIGDAMRGTTTTQLVGAYGTGFSKLPVTGSTGDTITFRAKISGDAVYATTTQTVTYFSGNIDNLDLSFIHPDFGNAPENTNPPGFPHSFYGGITFDDTPAPTGTIIEALIGSEMRGTTTTQVVGVYGNTGFNKLPVTGSAGDTITFRAKIPSDDNYTTIDLTIALVSGSITYLDLHFYSELVIPEEILPPTIINIAPTGTLDKNLFNITIETDKTASCRFDYSAKDYDLMLYDFDTSDNLHHLKDVYFENGDYTLFTLCRNDIGVSESGTTSFTVNVSESYEPMYISANVSVNNETTEEGMIIYAVIEGVHRGYGFIQNGTVLINISGNNLDTGKTIQFLARYPEYTNLSESFETALWIEGLSVDMNLSFDMHNLMISNMTLPETAIKGTSVTVSATLENTQNTVEELNVSFYVDGLFIEQKNYTLTQYGSEILNFVWVADTVGLHNLSFTIDLQEDQYSGDDNVSDNITVYVPAPIIITSSGGGGGGSYNPPIIIINASENDTDNNNTSNDGDDKNSESDNNSEGGDDSRDTSSASDDEQGVFDSSLQDSDLLLGGADIGSPTGLFFAENSGTIYGLLLVVIIIIVGYSFFMK